MLGALIEKAGTTPDSYPLSSNALVAACNQSTNRDPVMAMSERDVDQVMLQLRELGLARTLSGTGHRVPKHRHVVEEAMGLDGSETAVLAVLLLRGAQTRNEITARTERYADGPGGDTDAVDATLDRLVGRAEPLVVRLERRPGEREPRIDQLWADRGEGAAPAAADGQADPAPRAPSPPTPATTPPTLDDDRIAVLERQLVALTARLAALEAALGIEPEDES